MKKAIIAILVILWLGVFLVSGYLKIQSYIIGIYTKIDISQAEVRDMQRFFREFEAKYDSMDEKTRHEYEKARIGYEIKALNALEPFVGAIEEGNQIGT